MDNVIGSDALCFIDTSTFYMFFFLGQNMNDSVHKATAQFGLLSGAGDRVNIVDLCHAFEDMKHRNAIMEMEVEDLKKTRATFEEMVRYYCWFYFICFKFRYFATSY